MKYYIIQVHYPLWRHKSNGWPQSFVISRHMKYSRAIDERDKRVRRAKKWRLLSSYVIVRLSKSVA